MDEQPFSDTGMIVFGTSIVAMAVLAIVVTIAAYMFGGRYRLFSGCGGCMVSLILGGAVVFVATLVAGMV
ncbi:MAG: hypothetical protein L0G94_04080 [Brachybacterium sp.]|uniref:hypothetical protein n=1 Tax=Brachybacterium sp. TaxID=1891286 RepID=UPI00264A322E|nr:hypothetical protein [Brachybacterium sp.]MDN5685848.1 hypothetical protein [Brachybacterium sp.]